MKKLALVLPLLVFLSSCSSIKDSIVGSWRESSKPNSCVVFGKDGRFTSKSSKFKDDFVLVGSYSFSTDKEMKMTFDQELFGVKELDTTVVLNGSNVTVSSTKNSQVIMQLERSNCE
jgi:hypothetical protein